MRFYKQENLELLILEEVWLFFSRKSIILKLSWCILFHHLNTLPVLFLTNIGIINLTTIYYPGYSPKHKYTQVQFLLDFKDFLNSCSEGIHLVTGDFNIHYENSDKHETKLLKNILDQNNFTQLITFPTHKAKGTIDLCIINNSALKYISDLNRNNDFFK